MSESKDGTENLGALRGSSDGKLEWVIRTLDEWLINSADRMEWLERNHRYMDAAVERSIHKSYQQAQMLVERAKQPIE